MSTCIITPYYKNKDGYGQATWRGKQVLHHRLTYCLYNKLELAAIKGLVVMHSCDNPGCINPDHLELGTQKANLVDMSTKQRNRRGVAHHATKLTEDDVRLIRRSFGTLAEIAAKYEVSIDTISKIINKKTWRHV